MVETPIPTSRCPDCGYQTNCASGTQGGERPSPGQLSVCLNCGCLCEFGADLTQRKMTPEQIADLPADVLQHIARVENARRRTVGGMIGGLHRQGANR